MLKWIAAVEGNVCYIFDGEGSRTVGTPAKVEDDYRIATRPYKQGATLFETRTDGKTVLRKLFDNDGKTWYHESINPMSKAYSFVSGTAEEIEQHFWVESLIMDLTS